MKASNADIKNMEVSVNKILRLNKNYEYSYFFSLQELLILLVNDIDKVLCICNYEQLKDNEDLILSVLNKLLNINFYLERGAVSNTSTLRTLNYIIDKVNELSQILNKYYHKDKVITKRISYNTRGN